MIAITLFRLNSTFNIQNLFLKIYILHIIIIKYTTNVQDYKL